jgi:hypothetical protein
MRFRNLTTALATGTLLIGSSLPLHAQRRPAMPTSAVAERQSMLFIGGTQLDITDLNARFAAAGYPAFDEQFLQLGYAAARARDRLLLGVEVAGQLRPAATRADNRYRTRVIGGYAMFNLGIDAFQQGGFSLQPKVGIGGGGINVQITDREAPTFDEVLAQPGRGVQLTSGTLIVDGSLGIVYRFRPRSTARGPRGFLVGARGGYTQSLLRGEWMRDATDAPGGPRAGWAGPHLEFMIGRTTRR